MKRFLPKFYRVDIPPKMAGGAWVDLPSSQQRYYSVYFHNPDILQWCVRELGYVPELVQHDRGRTISGGYTPIVFNYYIKLATKHDVVMFKLKWL